MCEYDENMGSHAYRIRGAIKSPAFFKGGADGRGDRTRTCGILLPKQALYQTELRPALHRVYGCNKDKFITFWGGCQVFE